MSQDIATLGLRVDATPVREGDRALDSFERTSRRAAAAADNLGKKSDILTRIYKDLAKAAVALKLADIIRDSALLAARFETMGVVMGVAGNNAGYTRAQMSALETQMTKTGISMIKSREILTTMATANIDLAKATELARAAQDLAVVGDINSSDAAARLVRGIQAGEVEILKTIGLNVNFEAALKKTAAQLNKNVKDLTEQEKTLARTNVALEASKRYAGIYEESMGTAGKAVNSLTRYWEDLKVKAGDTLLPSLTEGVFKLTDALKAANKELEKAGSDGMIGSIGNGLGTAFRIVLKNVVLLGGDAWYVLQQISTTIGGVIAQGQALATGGWAAAAKVREKVAADLKLQGDALDTFRAKYLEANKPVVQTPAQVAAAKAVADAKEAQRIADGKAAKEAQEAEAKRLATQEAAAKQQKKYDDAYKDAIKSIEDRTAALALDDVTQGHLTEGQKFAVQVLDNLRNGTLRLTAAQKVKLAGELEGMLTLERLTAARDADLKAQKAAEEAAALEVTALWDQVRAMEKQVEMFGLTERATLELEKIRLQAVINGAARLELSDAEIAKYEQMLAAVTALAKATGQLDTKKELKKQADDARQAWQKTADAIENALTNSIMSGFSNGKGFAQNFYDSVVALFKTMVLQPSVSAIGQAGAGMVKQGLSALSGDQTGGSMLSSLMGGASATGALYNAFTSSTLGQFVSGFGGQAGAASQMLGGAPLTASAQAGSWAAAATPIVSGVLGGLAAYGVGEKYGGAKGTALGMAAGAGTVAAGGALVGAAAGTGAMAGAGAALAAIPGWGWAAMAGLAILGGMQKGPEENTRLTFGSNNAAGNISINERGNEGKNQSYIDDSSTGAFGSFGVVSSFWMSSSQPAVQSFIKTVTATDDALAKFMTATEQAATVAALTARTAVSRSGAEGTDPNGQGGLDSVFADRINTIMRTVDPALAAMLDGFTGTSQALAAEAAALLDYRKNLPAASEAIFGAVVTLQDLAALRTPAELTSAALVRVTSAFVGTNSAAQALGVSAETMFGQIGLASLAARQRLIDLAGGVDVLNAGTSYFAQNFLPEADRMAPIVAALATRMGDLGYAGVTTADGFGNAVMGLVNSGALATEAGAKTYVELLKMSEAFKYVGDTAKAAEAASAAAAKAAEDAARAQADILLANVDKALTVVERVVDAERARRETMHELEMKALDERIAATSSGLEKTRALSQALAGTLDQMTIPDRGAAQAQVAAALAIARAGGPLPSAGDLSGALATLSQDASGMFSTLQDFQRDQARTANDLAALAGLSGTQESAQQQLLDALNAQRESAQTAYDAEAARLEAVMAAAQKQVELLTSVDISLLTVARAMAALEASVGEARANSTVAAGIPQFASGGRHAGGWRVVGERGPEVEYTGPSSIASNASARSLVDNSGLEAEVRAMRQELTSGLMTIARYTKKAGDTLEQFNHDGMPATRED